MKTAGSTSRLPITRECGWKGPEFDSCSDHWSSAAADTHIGRVEIALAGVELVHAPEAARERAKRAP